MSRPSLTVVPTTDATTADGVEPTALAALLAALGADDELLLVGRPDALALPDPRVRYVTAPPRGPGALLTVASGARGDLVAFVPAGACATWTPEGSDAQDDGVVVAPRVVLALLATARPAPAAAMPPAVTFVVACGSDEAAAALTVLDVVEVAAAHPQWDAHLVLILPTAGALAGLREGLGGDVTCVVADGGADGGGAFARGQEAARGRARALLVAGERVNAEAVAALVAAGGAARTGAATQPAPGPAAAPARSATPRGIVPAPRTPADAAPAPRVTLVLPVTDGAEDTLAFLEALAAAQDANRTPFDLVVVDDATSDATAALLATVGGDVRVVRTPAPVGRQEACRLGAHEAHTDLLVLLHTAARPTGDWLDVLVGRQGDAALPTPSDVGAAGSGTRRLLVRREDWAPGPAAGARGVRVLLVPHSYPPSSRGGVQAHVAALAAQLPAQGVTPVVFHPHRDPARPDYEVTTGPVEGVEVIRVNRPHNAWHQEHGDERFEQLFAAVLRERRIDVAHFHHLCDGLSPSLLEVAASAGVRTVLTLHDAYTSCLKGHAVDATDRACRGPESLEACVACVSRGDGRVAVEIGRSATVRTRTMDEDLACADLVTAPSAYLARLSSLAPWAAGRTVEVRPLGLDVTDLVAGAPAAAVRAAGEPLRVGVLGNLERHPSGTDTKGVGVVVAAARALPDVVFSLHGSVDAEFAALLASVPNSHVHGPYAPAQRAALLTGVHCLLVASPVENYSTVVREALALGVPVVTGDGGGLPELVQHERNGLVVPSGDLGAVVAALAALRDDEPLRRRLAAAPTPLLTAEQDAAGWAATYAELLGPALEPVPTSPVITVAVTTEDAGRPALERTLAALAATTLPAGAVEVLLVGTADQLAGTGVTPLPVRPVPVSGSDTAGAAARAASAPLLMLLEAGDAPTPGALAEHVRAHRAHPGETDVIVGDVVAAPAGLPGPLARAAQQVLAVVPGGTRDLGDAGDLPWCAVRAGATSYPTGLLRRHPLPSGPLAEVTHAWALRTAGLRVWRAEHAVTRTSEVGATSAQRSASAVGAAAAALAATDATGELAALLRVDRLAERLACVREQLPQAQHVLGQVGDAPRSHLRATPVVVGDGAVTPASALAEQSWQLVLEEARLLGAAAHAPAGLVPA